MQNEKLYEITIRRYIKHRSHRVDKKKMLSQAARKIQFLLLIFITATEISLIKSTIAGKAAVQNNLHVIS